MAAPVRTTRKPAAPRASTDVRGRAAAERALTHNVTVELWGRRVELPPGDQLAFLGGLGVLVVLEIIEWPLAAAIGVGHVLIHNAHRQALREFGEALEEA
ncbi:hypothetical protein GCM10010191_73720 [Actinomadura vinacea]|uniref:Uncharacterized protein n=1 Tax=Actinomadura vinacea TaxID=115336 RepID=A0ABP5X5J7_9ACTN